MALLSGKVALITGIANKWSLAYAVARTFAQEGAEQIFTVASERIAEKVEELVRPLGYLGMQVCDVSDDSALDALTQAIKKGHPFGLPEGRRVDIVFHSIAYAPAADLEGPTLEASRAGFHTAVDVSAYSFLALAQRLSRAGLLAERASLITMTYLGGPRVVPGYNLMGVAKAALESIVRYLANDLGPERKARVNAISAGPVRTAAARGVKGFDQILEEYPRRAPLRENVTHEDIANAALFLASPLSERITGQVLYVDSGHHVMGM